MKEQSFYSNSIISVMESKLSPVFISYRHHNRKLNVISWSHHYFVLRPTQKTYILF